jgi:hypothetical protein
MIDDVENDDDADCGCGLCVEWKWVGVWMNNEEWTKEEWSKGSLNTKLNRPIDNRLYRKHSRWNKFLIYKIPYFKLSKQARSNTSARKSNILILISEWWTWFFILSIDDK